VSANPQPADRVSEKEAAAAKILGNIIMKNDFLKLKLRFPELSGSACCVIQSDNGNEGAQPLVRAVGVQ
jgi:hypothetical protein